MDKQKGDTQKGRPEDAGEASFESRLERLRAIVGELEQGDLGLEPAIERYQEGIELLKHCHATLASYKQRVEELSTEAEAKLTPYAADPDVPAAPSKQAC
jgi:exodeoxyribonuclease VII small subunit